MKQLASALLLLAGVSFASAATLNSLPSDASPADDGSVQSVSTTAIEIGNKDAAPSQGLDLAAVFVFQLPLLNPGESVVNANFLARIVENDNPLYNLDLYGLGFRALDAVLGSDFYSGATLDATDATLIEDNFVLPADNASATEQTSPTGDTALAAYLNAQYAAGAGGNFVFLRLSGDFTPPLAGTLQTYFAGSSTNATQVPVVTFDVVPEPSAAMMILGGLGMFGLLRRRNR